MAEDDLVAAAAVELARIAHVFDAAAREGVGCLVLRDPAGQLIGAWVDDDVPAGILREQTSTAYVPVTTRSAA